MPSQPGLKTGTGAELGGGGNGSAGRGVSHIVQDRRLAHMPSWRYVQLAHDHASEGISKWLGSLASKRLGGCGVAKKRRMPPARPRRNRARQVCLWRGVPTGSLLLPLLFLITDDNTTLGEHTPSGQTPMRQGVRPIRRTDAHLR